MKPPPPMLPAVGCTTASANAVATAASTAVPPAAITSAPICDAISFCDATMPFCARTGTELAPVVIDRTTQTATVTRTRALVMRRIISTAATVARGGPSVTPRPIATSSC